MHRDVKFSFIMSKIATLFMEFLYASESTIKLILSVNAAILSLFFFYALRTTHMYFNGHKCKRILQNFIIKNFCKF